MTANCFFMKSNKVVPLVVKEYIEDDEIPQLITGILVSVNPSEPPKNEKYS